MKPTIVLKKRKILVFVLLALVTALSGPVAAFAQEEIKAYFFFTRTCPHCTEEKIFLEELESRCPHLRVEKLNVFHKENADLLKEFYKDYGVPSEEQYAFPIIFVGDQYFIGFNNEIKDKLEGYLLKGTLTDPSGEESLKSISLPVFGEVDISKIGLLAFSVLIGVVDGFNACAMWALFFLLTFLVASGSRKRVFLIGSTFIFVSGLVYFLFISAWLNLFLFIGHLKIIQTVISLLAIIFGLVCVKDFFAFGKGISFILPKKTRDKILERMKTVTNPKLSLSATILGVALLAAGVNLVELLCTTGFPAVFSKVLSAHHLPAISSYFYLLIYIFFYMLDEFIIFSVVTLTLGVKPLPDKYKRVSKLISGFILLVLGLTMLIRPEALMFQ